LLIPAGYPEAISEAVLQLIASPNRRLCMGRAAREWVIERFVNGHVLGLTVGYYKSLLEAPEAEDVSDLARDAAAAGD
jgi:hypothetical protein